MHRTLGTLGEEAAANEKLSLAIQETTEVSDILQKDEIVCSTH
jgi:hypothetical protein